MLNNHRLTKHQFALTLFFLCFCSALPANPLTQSNQTAENLKPFSAKYLLQKKGMTIAEILYRLSKDDSGFTFSTYAKPKGLAAWISSTPVTEESKLKIIDNKLLPTHYIRNHTGKKDAKIQNMEINYAYESKKAFVSVGENKHEYELGGGLWDEASILLAITQDLKNSKNNLSYQLIDDNELKNHHYTAEIGNILKTTIGKFQTVKITRVHGKRKTMMWFAPESDYLLVKVQRFRKDRLKSEMILKSVE